VTIYNARFSAARPASGTN